MAGFLVLSGLALLGFSARKAVTLVVDGTERAMVTYAATVGGLLQQAGVVVGPQDHLSPAASDPLADGAVVDLQRARSVRIWADGLSRHLLTQEDRVANLLAEGGVDLYPGDRFWLNGRLVDPDIPVSLEPANLLFVDRAVPIELTVAGRTTTIHSTAPTLGQALWEAGVQIHEADILFPGASTPLDRPMQARLDRSRALTVQVEGQTLRLRATSGTVGEALAEAGLALQGLDYSRPAEDAPLPADGRIQVVRVREEIQIEQEPLPFETEFQPDPTLELDQQRLIEPGAFGLQAARVVVRYEDGQEVSRQRESAWVAVPPTPRVMGYGTQVVVRTLETPGGTIEYWRAVTMYATSYSPCRIFRDRCSYVTASGARLQNGVAAVIPAWYWTMGGSQVYVPGYGVATILDTGRGIPGRDWIDLGYTDEDFRSWHNWVTVYFLTPVPAQILFLLP